MKTSILKFSIFLALLFPAFAEITPIASVPSPQSERKLSQSVHHEEIHHQEVHHEEVRHEEVYHGESRPKPYDIAAESPQIQFESGEDAEKTRNYKKISEDLGVFEEEYSNCIKEIEDEEYTQEKIDECVGRNFIKVVLDIKYITLKIMAKLDTKVRRMFIKECYEPAGVIEEFSVGCDVLEKDVLDMMWNGLEFVELVEINKEKYLFEYGKIPNDNYRALFTQLEVLSREFFELLDEVDSHKEVIILRLKTLIDDRTKLILEKATEDEGFVKTPANEIHHTIEITETVMPDEQQHFVEERKLNQQTTKKQAKNNQLGAQSGISDKREENPPRLGLQGRLQRNKEFKKQVMVNKLSNAVLQQGKMPFKNVHTAHYQNGKH